MTQEEKPVLKIVEHNRLLIIPDMSELTGGSMMVYAGGMYRSPEPQVIEWERVHELRASDLESKKTTGE